MNNSELISNPGGGVILLGKEGTGVLEDALKLAEDIVNYNTSTSLRWDSHPDIHIIDLEEGAKDIKLAQIAVIGEQCNINPRYARVNVFVIGHAVHMNLAVQNSLLKVLEDGYDNNVIIMCCEDRLIETVCNRSCIMAAGRTCNQDELINASKSAGISVGVIKALSDGRYEWLEQMQVNGTLSEVAKMVDSIRFVKETRELFFTLDAMTEDKNSFVKRTGSIEQLSLMYGLENIFMAVLTGTDSDYMTESDKEHISKLYDSEWILLIVQELISSRVKIQKRIFTVNDYFKLVRACVDRKSLY